MKKRRPDKPQENQLVRMRRRVGILMLGCAWLVILWMFMPGIPVFWGPSASAAVREAGRELFVHEWQPNDPMAHGGGLGPVFNAKSCAACHDQGGLGGGGGNAHNVMSFDIHPTSRNGEFRTGVVHAAACDKSCRETPELVKQLNPVIKGGTRTVDHCTVRTVDFDPVKFTPIQSTALFGAGWVDKISPRSISHTVMNQAIDGISREMSFDFGTIPPGRTRILPDGRVGKFGWKAQFATLEEFVSVACANELGLTTPKTQKAKPLGKPNTEDTPTDLDRTQFHALVSFVATLPKPVEVEPADPKERESAVHGKSLFNSVGCAVCHVPDLGGVKSVYSDFLLHKIEDVDTPGSGYEPEPPDQPPIPTDIPRPEEWKTPALWGVADSAPYFHDGKSKTLRDAILRHKGDSKAVTEAYTKLTPTDQNAVLAFLRTLKAPVDAIPATKVVAKR